MLARVKFQLLLYMLAAKLCIFKFVKIKFGILCQLLI